MYYVAGYYDDFDRTIGVDVFKTYSSAEAHIHALLGKVYLDYLRDAKNGNESKEQTLTFISTEIDNFEIDSDRETCLDIYIDDYHYFIREVEENGR